MKNKEKYDLTKLKIKWNDHESLAIYADDGVYKMNSNSNAILLRGLVNWLEDEYKEPILDEKEKEYLSAVIRPWRDKVSRIFKFKYGNNERIAIETKVSNANICFPYFKEGTMYKGMEQDREYSLEDLGI